MEEYALEQLRASADAAFAGLGPVVAGMAVLAEKACREVTLDGAETLVADGGRELLRQLLQLTLDRQAAGEVRLAQVTGADGVARRRAGPSGHHVITTLGQVRAARLAYRSGVKGAGALHPRDALLDLPARRYSWRLQQMAVTCAQSGAYELAGEMVRAMTGVSIGKRQLEQITIEAAADAEQFFQHQRDAGQDQDGDGTCPDVLVMSADGKGVAMLPGSRRARSVAPEDRVRVFGKHRGTGEKGHKRMAEVGCVFDVRVPPPGAGDDPDGPARTPEQVMASRADTGTGKGRVPGAVNRRYVIDIDAGRDVTIGTLFDEAERRDPGRQRTRIALLDGDNYQLAQFQAQAAARGITLFILIDFIHVLGYLWKAAWCFYPGRDPAIEPWVTGLALDILHGRVSEVITTISQLAATQPPQRKEHIKIIRKTLHYLEAKKPWLDGYPAALAAGWPIATGVIEGACRHLVQDRMAITGARWSTKGAQAILWLRAISASGDRDPYWTWHIQQEHHRNHTSRYQNDLALAA